MDSVRVCCYGALLSFFAAGAANRPATAQKGSPHETPALSYSLKGSTRLLTLREEDLREAKAALSRYRDALARLDRLALAGIDTFRRKIEKEKARMKGK